MAEETSDQSKPTKSIKSSQTKLKKRFRKIEASTLKHGHTFIVQRWANILEVRRHAIAWIILVGLIITCVLWQAVYSSGAYSQPVAAEGGAFSEGMSGKLDTMNPIFATSLAERSAVRLIFSGLLRYDSKNNLSGDLAESWRNKDDGKRVIVTLKPNLYWHDGFPITAKDVVYTIDTIKNADVRSPLLSSWRNIKVRALSERMIEFNLPTVYAPFLHSLTLGILPEHQLDQIPAVELRNATFNRAPVGSGPFVFKDIKSLNGNEDHVVLNTDAYPKYHLGHTKLSKFYIHAFADEDQLRQSFLTDEINAAVDLSTQSIANLSEAEQANVDDSALYNGTYAFFKMSNPILKDMDVRKALRLATNRSEIISQLDNRVQSLNGPLIDSQLLPIKSKSPLKQPGYNPRKAERLLDKAGWRKNAEGKRFKGKKPLQLTLVSIQSSDFPMVIEAMAEQWNEIGVDVQTRLVQSEDFQQNILTPRAYDVLVYELSIGRDPDVYAYWHSSQAGARGLNLSDYSSGIVDDALTSARTRLEPKLRDVKYKAFYKQWLSDAPAVALYQPTLHYISSPNASTLNGQSIVDAVDRYTEIRYWSSAVEAGRQTP